MKKPDETKALVNKIIPFSAVDGPGNRTAIFLQGCNLNCQYCHNPETIDPKDFSPNIRLMTAREVFDSVMGQTPYIRGITVSGGECMRYPEFLAILATLCKENNLSVLLDSNGTIDFSQYPKLLKYIDGVMLDIKAYDESEHRAITGKTNAMVLKNLDYLYSIGKLEEIRTVVAEGLFDVENTVKRAVRKGVRYKLIRFRANGVRPQYADIAVPSEELMEKLEHIALEGGAGEVVRV